MKKKTLAKFFSFFILAFLILQSCKNDSYLLTPPPIPGNSFVEQFDTLTAAQNRGWVIKNRSIPIGPAIWSQSAFNTAYSSQATSNGCIFSNVSCCHDSIAFTGTVSNWVISPVTTLQNNDHIIFYTKTTDGTWGDRLQVCINIKDTSTECGRADDPGNFSIKLLDIDSLNVSNDAANIYSIPAPFYIYDPVNSYPTAWTRFDAIVSGLSKPTQGRFAFRHYVPNGGDDGMGIEILLDSIAYVSVNHH
jgi:hypothetical protein